MLPERRDPLGSTVTALLVMSLGACAAGPESCATASADVYFSDRRIVRDLSTEINSYPELAHEVGLCREAGFSNCHELIFGYREASEFEQDAKDVLLVTELNRYRAGCTYDFTYTLTPPDGLPRTSSDKYTVPARASTGGDLWLTTRLRPDRGTGWTPGTWRASVAINGVVQGEPTFTMAP
jgi:hypothetical protein